MVRASDVFDDDADAKVQEVKAWLKARGVRDFEPVSLFADQLNKVRCSTSLTIFFLHCQ